MEPGQVRYSTMCNEAGGIVDDVTVYSFDDEHFMIVTSSGPRLKTARWIREHAAGTSAYATDITAGTALLTVQGPRSRAFLKSVVQDIDLDTLKFFRFARGRIGEVELLVSRSGYTGELGYELYVPAEQAGVSVGAHRCGPGSAFKLQPYGVGGHAEPAHREGAAALRRRPQRGLHAVPCRPGPLDRLQEARLHRARGAAAGAGAGAAAALGRADPAERDAGRGQRPVYSIADVATFREQALQRPRGGRAARTRCWPASSRSGTSPAAPSGHSVGEMLAMAYVDTAHSWPGHNLVVVINGRPVLARVAATPFFDPRTPACGPGRRTTSRRRSPAPR